MSGSDIGGCVRRAREQRGLSLSDAAKLTKLSPIVLRAIESNDFDSLPGGMYRKAYLRIVAAEVGLDPVAIGVAYDDLQRAQVEPLVPSERTNEALVDDLMPSRRRSVVTIAIMVALGVGWFAFRGNATSTPPDITPAETAVAAASAVEPAAVGPAGEPQAADVTLAAAPQPHDRPLRVSLATTGWCWMSVERDGERVVYGLIEPGRNVIVEGETQISLKLGDAGAVQLSVNDGPARSLGDAGEVVELDVTADDLPASAGLSN